jgi:hypothetical protein
MPTPSWRRPTASVCAHLSWPVRGSAHRDRTERLAGRRRRFRSRRVRGVGLAGSCPGVRDLPCRSDQRLEPAGRRPLVVGEPGRDPGKRGRCERGQLADLGTPGNTQGYRIQEGPDDSFVGSSAAGVGDLNGDGIPTRSSAVVRRITTGERPRVRSGSSSASAGRSPRWTSSGSPRRRDIASMAPLRATRWARRPLRPATSTGMGSRPPGRCQQPARRTVDVRLGRTNPRFS